MNYHLRFTRRLPLFCLIVFGWLLALTSLRAQSVSTGSITGRVFDPATNEYLGNAEVRLQGTLQFVTTAGDGSFTFSSVLAGPATVVVNYTGYNTATVNVTVAAGATATADVKLVNSLDKTDTTGETVKLAAFTVSTEREGNAKAIMDQRQSMNVSNIVSSETFGNIAEGNIGEFVKYLPGIQMDYVEADARSPRIRGLPAQFTTVTLDGMKVASADGYIQANGTDNGGGAGAGDRSFGFEQVTMSAIDAIEVNFTTNASQDADSPAGNINLRSTHAYERNGQQITFSASGMINSEELYLHRIDRPDNSSESMIRPNASFSYANSFFNHRLGITFAVNESNTFNEQRQFAPTYDTTPTATDPRPLVINKLSFKDGPKFSERSAVNLNIDFKATDHLSFSLKSALNNYDAFVANRTFAVASTRANIGGDGLSAWNNVPITAITWTMQGLNKRTHGYYYIPGFEYKLNNILITGAMSITESTNNYGGGQSKSLPGSSVAGVSLSTTGMTVSATHPADNNYAWTIVQTGGQDWANINNYKAAATAYPMITVDGRFNSSLIYQAKLDGKYTTNWTLPTWFQVGSQVSENTWIFQNPGAWQTWNYTGPGGGLGGTWANFPSGTKFDPGHGAAFISLTGGAPMIPDQNAIGALFQAHPEYFTPAGTAANYLNAFVTQPKYVKEQVDAVYGMFNIRPLRKLLVQAGLRWEQTRDELKDYNPIPSAQVVAAGYPITASTGQASTIPGIAYQYFTNPRAARSTSYNRPFPSLSAKYDITPNLTALFGYSYTISRPSFGDLSGTYSIDDSTSTITIPNSDVKPQYANNYSARLTYYFEPVGSLGVGVFENDFKNFTQTQTLGPGSAAQFGFTDPIYADYSVNTKVNLPGTNVYKGLTVEYSQALSFLPERFKGFNVFANYTRTITEVDGVPSNILNAATPYNYGWLPGTSPNVVSYGISYSYRRVSASVNARWQDKTRYTGTYNTFQKQATKLDVNAAYKITDRWSLYFYARNILDVPDYIYANNNPQQIGGGRAIEYYGAYLYGGIRARF